ncbi:hypothetical protein PTTG_03697 [Puccinia triticina 1-1 BBBD Race 1]|uniref:Homeobox domain-containing protein n=1 Tax=Puccinia triticina (isolate 1-1 / race 1 (BBBD)) TaxID=630390 RepID=A0A180GI56_PUCT1|nr:hypothetical protein PTTG_03697 [Puccinia triticina 1-1 BBBD Race 1]
MMVTPWWNTTLASALRAKTLVERYLPSSILSSLINRQRPVLPPLRFPEIGALAPQLVHLGLSQDYAVLLDREFTAAVKTLDETLFKSFETAARKFYEKVELPSSRPSFVQALHDHHLGLRAQFIQKLWTTLESRAHTLIEQSRSAQSTSQSSPPSSPASTSSGTPSSYGHVKPAGKPRGRAPKFTKEQTAALNALLARDNQYSSEDKELIAHELNLTREQVNRWFCNARARKKPYSCPSRQSAAPAIKSLASNTSSPAPIVSTSPPAEQIQSPERPSTGSSEDTDMIFLTSASSSSASSSEGEDEDEPMNAYLDFSACPESWPQQHLAPLPPVSFDFGALQSSCAFLAPTPASADDLQRWNPQAQTPNFQSFAC